MQHVVKVPAEYVDEFRAALVVEIGLEAEFIQGHRKKAEELDKWDDAQAEGERATMREDMGLLAADMELLALVGYEGDGELTIPLVGKAGPGRTDASTVAHVCESMARTIVGPRLSEWLGSGPHDENAAVEMRELIARLSWAIDRAAELHRISVPTRNGKAA